MNTTDHTAGCDLNAALTRMKHSWQSGLLLCAAVRLAGEALVALSVYGVADAFLALADGVRIVLGILLAAALAALAVARVIRMLRITNEQMARRGDSLLRSSRRAVLSAWELDRWISAGGAGGVSAGLTRFLVERSIGLATASLRGLQWKEYFPFAEVRRELKAAGLKLLIPVFLLILNPNAARTVLGRMLLPGRDIPPYSRYTLTVSPAQPSVFYGGTVELAVDIVGGPVNSPVAFVTRYQGRRQSVACFQESPQRFAQRLERVVSPVEVCFSMGKARSRWHPVQVIYQPIITLAEVAISPPAYTLLPQRRFFAGTESLAGIRGSRASLTLTSNRPLLDGVMTLTYRSGTGRDEAMRGLKTGAHTVTFDWTLKEPAQLELSVRDMRGAKNKEPYKLDQKVLPDNPPEAAITEPVGFALATPKITLALQGYAADDYGLRRVELVQTVAGYRDRAKFIGPASPERRFDFDAPADLQAIGVEAGQLLEFYLEASDQNPLMTGATASDIVRVRIISEDDYAAILRERTTLDAFLNRYRRLTESLAEVKTALREFKAAAESGRAPASELERLRERAARVHETAADLFYKTSTDFPIFDCEATLADALAALINPLRKNEQMLALVMTSDPRLPQIIDLMLARLGEQEASLGAETQRAEDIARVARVMEAAAVFNAIVLRQTALVRRLARFEPPASEKSNALLAALGRNQAEIREALAALCDRIEEAAGRLPEDYAELGDSAREFVDALAESGIAELMQAAVTAAGNQAGPQTARHARHALEKLLELAKSQGNSPFGGLTGKRMNFGVGPGLKDTLEQMLAAMNPGQGNGAKPGFFGVGWGGGNTDDGFAMAQTSLLDIPVFGPARDMPPAPGGGSGTGQSNATCQAGAPVTATAADTLTVPAKGPPPGESLPAENIPEKYREALKRYFNQEGNPS